MCFYDVSGVDFAGDTISIVHRDRKVEVAPKWATVYFQKGYPKKRAGVRTPWTPSLDPPLLQPTESSVVLYIMLLLLSFYVCDSNGSYRYEVARMFRCHRQYEVSIDRDVIP